MVHRFFEWVTEVYGWIRIVLSPFLIASFLGIIVYTWQKNTLGLSLAIAIAVLGMIIGILWANKVWKKGGTIHFLSRIMATPELDKKEEDGVESI